MRWSTIQNTCGNNSARREAHELPVASATGWRPAPKESSAGDTFCKALVDVSPSGLVVFWGWFPVAHATGRDVSASGLNRRQLLLRGGPEWQTGFFSPEGGT